MRRLMLSLAIASAALAGCKTTEVLTEPAVGPMPEAEFSTALQNAKAHANPYMGEQHLTALIHSKAVNAEQRSRALYARATQRWKKTSDKAGAKTDFDEYVRSYPSGAFANNASYESGYVRNELQSAEARLRTVQTLRAWFDDTWSLGRRDEAASRYRRSGLTPEPHQIYALRAKGFLCEGSGAMKVHHYGALTTEIQDLYWCK